MFEGFHLMALNWGLRLGYLAAAGLLLWPLVWLHAAGAVVFTGLIAVQKIMLRPAAEAKTVSPASSGKDG
jgi:uncharacterized membrane protein